MILLHYVVEILTASAFNFGAFLFVVKLDSSFIGATFINVNQSGKPVLIDGFN